MQRILGNWDTTSPPGNVANQFVKIAAVNRQFEQWTINQSLLHWHSTDIALPQDINTNLQLYLQQGQVLPLWADHAKIEHDEEAYLHCWSVVGHVLGIHRDRLIDTMAQGAEMLAQMQARRRARLCLPDPRPALGSPLMRTTAKAIPFLILKGFPVLMTQYLCGAICARKIGVTARLSWVTYALFVLGLTFTKAVDSAVKWVLPEFSISLFFTRVVSYHFNAGSKLRNLPPAGKRCCNDPAA